MLPELSTGDSYQVSSLTTDLEALVMGTRPQRHVLRCTLISAELDVSEQADFDDLPQEAQHQMWLPLFQVQSSNVHYMAADCRGRVQG